VVAEARGNIRILAQDGFRTVARGPRTEAPLDAQGCASLPDGAGIGMRVVRAAPISVVGEEGAVAALEWRDSWGVGVMEVAVGAESRILWLTEPGDDRTTLSVTALGAPLVVCGLRR